MKMSRHSIAEGGSRKALNTLSNAECLAGGRVSGDNAQDSIWRNVALELADQLVQVLSDLHNAWEFEVKTEKQFDGLMHAAITKAIQERDCLHRRAEPGKEGA